MILFYNVIQILNLSNAYVFRQYFIIFQFIYSRWISWILIDGYYSWNLIMIRAQSFLKESLSCFLISFCTVLHQLDQKIIYPHYDFKHLTEKYFEIGMKLNDFSIQLVKYCLYLT